MAVSAFNEQGARLWRLTAWYQAAAIGRLPRRKAFICANVSSVDYKGWLASDIPRTIRESVPKVSDAFRPTFRVSTKPSTIVGSVKGSLSDDIVEVIMRCRINHTEASRTWWQCEWLRLGSTKYLILVAYGIKLEQAPTGTASIPRSESGKRPRQPFASD